MRQISKSCHANTGNNLPSLDLLPCPDGHASVRKVVISGIFTIWMLYDYKVAAMPVFYAWAADLRVIFDERNNTVCCGEHRGILCNYEINCIS